MSCNRPNCDMSGPEWAYRRLTRAHHAARDTVFDKLELKDVGQPVMLFILNGMRREGSSCTQRELADLMHISPSTVTASIKSLERRGYVVRRADENDLRRNLVEITDAGAAVSERCRLGFEDIDRAMYSGLSESERGLMTELFGRMTENLLRLAGVRAGGEETL